MCKETNIPAAYFIYLGIGFLHFIVIVPLFLCQVVFIMHELYTKAPLLAIIICFTVVMVSEVDGVSGINVTTEKPHHI